MNLEEIRTLYERCLAGVATPEEQARFENYKDQFDLEDIAWSPEMGDYETVKAHLANDLNERFSISKRKVLKFRYWAAAAASIAIFGSVFWFIADHSKVTSSIQQASLIKPVIKPGSNKAILITGNQQIVLDGKNKGTIAKQNGVNVVNDKDNQLVYQANDKQSSGATAFNTLVTPRGGQYELELADGTHVWLNADSRLRYPVKFSGTERVVELTGEAYFEVAKNAKMPFKVNTGSKVVEVLGTHFNVHAYPDEAYKTTLLEGSVKLADKSGAAATLKPGEQGMFDNSNKFNVSAVTAEDAIAWKNGIFMFKHENMVSVMNQIARWYDVDVQYEGDVKTKNLGGTVSRYQNISDLLKTIQLTESVHFKIEGRRVIAMP